MFKYMYINVIYSYSYLAQNYGQTCASNGYIYIYIIN